MFDAENRIVKVLSTLKGTHSRMGCGPSIGLSVTPEQGQGILISNSQPTILKSNVVTSKLRTVAPVETAVVEEIRNAASIVNNGGKSCRIVPVNIKTDAELIGVSRNDTMTMEGQQDQDVHNLSHEVSETGLLHRELKDILNPKNMIAAIKRGDIETVKKLAVIKCELECHVINAPGAYHSYTTGYNFTRNLYLITWLLHSTSRLEKF